MAEKNIVREDVVSLLFDIDDGGIKELNNMMKKIQNIVKDATGNTDDVLKDIKEEIDNVSNSVKNTTREFEKGFDSATKSVKDTEKEATKFKKELDKTTETASKGLKEKIVGGIKSAKSGFTALESKVVNTASKFKDFVNTKFDKLINGISKFNKKANESAEKVQKLSDETEGIGNGIKGTIANAAGTLAVGMTVKSAITTGMDFESGMSAVKAVSGATNAEMEKLTAKAEEMGRTTIFSASDAANALNYMAMAGWKSEQMLNGISGIMNLAAASGEDLGITSDIVTDALTAFGEKADEASNFADVLAMASSNANTNVSMMGETFKYVAPFAGTLKYSYKDVAIAIGLMANSSIKASQAGTSLRSLFTNLSAPTDKVEAAMKRLGLSLTDQNGNMKSFHQVMIDIRKGFKGITDETEKTAIATALAGKNASSGLLAIVNATEDDFNKVTNAINNANGAAEEMANIKNDNLLGQIEILKSGIAAIYIEFYKHIKEPLKKGVKWITDNIIPKITKGIEIITEKLAPIFKKIVPIIEQIINSISLKFEWLKNNIFPSLIEGFNSIRNAIIPIIQTIIEKAIGLFDRIFGLIMINKDTILSAWDSICSLFSFFTENILPELVNVFNWVIQTIAPIISDTINIISQAINEAIPFVKEGIDNIIIIIKGISPIVQGISKVILNIIKQVSKNMDKIIPILKLVAKGYIALKAAMLVYKGVVLATNIVFKAHEMWLKAVNIAETAYIVTLYATDVAMKILNATMSSGPWGWLIMIIGGVIAAVTTLCLLLGESDEEFEKNQAQIRKTTEEVTSFKDSWNDACKNLGTIDLDNLISNRGNTMSEIDNAIDEIEGQITNILKERFGEQQELREEDIANIKKYQQDIKNLQNEKLETYRTDLKNISDSILTIDTKSPNAIVEISSRLFQADEIRKVANAAADENHSSKLTDDRNIYLNNPVMLAAKRMEAREEYEAALKSNEEYYNNIVDDINRKSLSIIKNIAFGYRQIGQNVKNDYGTSFFEDNDEPYRRDLENLKSASVQTANQFIGTAAIIKSQGNVLSTAMKGAILDILSAYDGLDDGMNEIGKDSLLGLIKGLDEVIPGLEDTSTMTCQEIIDVIKNYLGIASPSKVFQEIGVFTMQGLQNGIITQSLFIMLALTQISQKMQNIFNNINLYSAGKNIVSGLINGISNQKERLKLTVKSVAEEVNKSFKAELDIHSPSRVMRENGQMVGEGVILGIKDKISNIKTSFNDIDTEMSMGYTPKNTSNNSSNSTYTENNNISPIFNIYVNDGNEETANKIQETLEEFIEEMFAGFSRRKPRNTEV